MADITGRKVASIIIQNYGRIKYIELEFDTAGGLIEVVSRKNAQGKTTLLNAFSRTFGGSKWDGPMPIHDGADKAMIQTTLDDGTVITITERFDKNGKIDGELVARDSRGLLYPKPQEALNKLYSTGLNPIEFFEWTKTAEGRRKQVEVMLACAGLTGQLEEIERLIATRFEERRQANVEVARLQGALLSMPVTADTTPDTEVTLKSLQDNLDAAQEYDRFVSSKALGVRKLVSARDAAILRSDEVKADIERLQQEYERLSMVEIPGFQQAIEELSAEIEALSPSWTEQAKEAFATADNTNTQVRQKLARRKVAGDLKAAIEKADSLSDHLDAARTSKVELLKGAKFPVEGIGFDENGVTLNGRPLSVASEAEAIVLSTTLAIRMNPKLKFLPVRSASGLGEDMRLLIAKTAVEEDCQVLLERIVSDETVGIVITDGRVSRDNREGRAVKMFVEGTVAI